VLYSVDYAQHLSGVRRTNDVCISFVFTLVRGDYFRARPIAYWCADQTSSGLRISEFRVLEFLADSEVFGSVNICIGRGEKYRFAAVPIPPIRIFRPSYISAGMCRLACNWLRHRETWPINFGKPFRVRARAFRHSESVIVRRARRQNTSEECAEPLNLRSCWHRATVRHPILKYRRRRRKRRRN